MDPWYKIVTPRKEVREGRSFNPDEFAIHLEQIVNGTAPEDYKNAEQFFARTCFTSALKEHCAMTLKRLGGNTTNTAPVMTLITQFGGGKTHTLASLYHLANTGDMARNFSGVQDFCNWTGLLNIPKAKVAVFVGNAWDPGVGKETPWKDIAWQLAGDKGVEALGLHTDNVPPGTETLCKVFAAAEAPVLILFDEVLNFMNRHRNMCDHFHAFIQNLTVAATGASNCAIMISLPRSQVEMTDWDIEWQEKITKVVKRVAKDLISNDESEISEVVRKRLFDDIGDSSKVKRICRQYAQWAFERRAQLPPELMVVDRSITEASAVEALQAKFEQCYPFHPATLAVFQKKWQALSQFQQTRGTLAMLAQWISFAYKTGYSDARKETLITLGSAPLEAKDFKAVVLGQLGEQRLQAAIDADLSGTQSHAKALDADAKDELKYIHQKVGTAIFFESSGGQSNKTAHLPELRFALGSPELDTTSIDSAAFALEDKAYYIRRIGNDGYRIGYQPTLKKVVNDRKASIDYESQLKPFIKNIIQEEFRKNNKLPISFFPADSSAIQDTTKLTIIVADPDHQWEESTAFKAMVAQILKSRGGSNRLYPATLIWCFKKQGKELRNKAELLMAWSMVNNEFIEGILGSEMMSSDRMELRAKLADAENAVRDEVWASYRYIALYSKKQDQQNLHIIDLGQGHSSANVSLSDRIISAMKTQALLNDSVGISYLERFWPQAFLEKGAWPLKSLRQSFLDGSLTRLIDPEQVLEKRIIELVENGDAGLLSQSSADGSVYRLWYKEELNPSEVMFESEVCLVMASKIGLYQTKDEASSEAEAVNGFRALKRSEDTQGVHNMADAEDSSQEDVFYRAPQLQNLKLSGELPFELWNKFSRAVLTKLNASSKNLVIKLDVEAELDSIRYENIIKELSSGIQEVNLSEKLKIE